MSIQAQVINLLHDLRERMGLTYLFIAHDLNIVKYISDRIAVMYLGSMVELATSDELYANTLHPYSGAAFRRADSRPEAGGAEESARSSRATCPADQQAQGLRVLQPLPAGLDKCRQSAPTLKEAAPEGHFVACHLVEAQG